MANSFDSFSTIFNVVFFIVVTFIVSIFVIMIVTVIRKSSANRKAPVLTCKAKAISKRTYNQGDFRSQYYVTFEFESGDRLELLLPIDRAGYIIEGDQGDLTFQGERFIDFK